MTQPQETKKNEEANNTHLNQELSVNPSNSFDKELVNKEDPLPKWIDNKGDEVTEVFGFNENAELVNGRAAMFGFLMLIITELVFEGKAATQAIFGIN